MFTETKIPSMITAKFLMWVAVFYETIDLRMARKMFPFDL